MKTKFLVSDPSASTDPNFDNVTFQEKFDNGWLKSYYYGILLLFIANIANALNNVKNGLYFMKNPMLKGLNHQKDGITWDGTYDYYNTWFFGVSLLIVAAVSFQLTFGIFLQFQAIRLKSLEKQEEAIKSASGFISSQAWATGISVFFALWAPPISSINALVAGFVVLAVGVGFKFLTSNVKNIMLGKAEESFKFNKSAFKSE